MESSETHQALREKLSRLRNVAVSTMVGATLVAGSLAPTDAHAGRRSDNVAKGVAAVVGGVIVWNIANRALGDNKVVVQSPQQTVENAMGRKAEPHYNERIVSLAAFDRAARSRATLLHAYANRADMDAKAAGFDDGLHRHARQVREQANRCVNLARDADRRLVQAVDSAREAGYTVPHEAFTQYNKIKQRVSITDANANYLNESALAQTLSKVDPSIRHHLAACELNETVSVTVNRQRY